jgi:hypothetical protein
MSKVSRSLWFVIAVGVIVFQSAPILAAPDPQGLADSMWIDVTDIFPDSILFLLKFKTDNTDSNRIAGIGLPFRVTVSNGALISLDTTIARTFASSAISSWPIIVTSTDSGGLDPTVSPVHFVIGGITFGTGIDPGNNLLLATIKLRVNWALLDSICIDTLSTGTLPNPTFVTEGAVDFIPRWYAAAICNFGDEVKTKRGKGASLPLNYELGQNFPNPFNATTQIQFSLPKNSQVKLEIFNILGQKVKTLVDEELQAGYKRITWDGTDQEGNRVASGLYFYRLRAGESFIEAKRMLLIK